MSDKLERGGIVTFASAAALTLAAWTIPVYEIYKVGAAPSWLVGLDLLGPLGLPVAVIPHYDNAEGGSHDTRFCFLGERRLAVLEAALPDDHFVLGVDSHTALILDFRARSATVLGLGGVTVRVAGRSHVFESGTTVPIDALREAASALRDGDSGGAALSTNGGAGSTPAPPPRDGAARSPLLDEVHALERRFEAALATDQPQEAIRAVLALESALVAWLRDTPGTDEVDRSRGVLQALIVQLGERSRGSSWPPADRLAPLADRLTPLAQLLIDARARALDARDFPLADRLRDALLDAGIEIRDTPEGTTWGARPGTTDR